MEAGTLTLRVQDQLVVFSLFEVARKPAKQLDCICIDVLDGVVHGNFTFNRGSIAVDFIWGF